MRLDLDQIEIRYAPQNNYVDIWPTSQTSAKKLLSRTRSEPPNLTKKPLVKGNSQGYQATTKIFNEHIYGLRARSHFAFRKLSPVHQLPSECSRFDSNESNPGNRPEKNENPEILPPQNASSKFLGDFVARHRRSLSITERELRKKHTHYDGVASISCSFQNKSNRLTSPPQSDNFPKIKRASVCAEKEVITTQPLSFNDLQNCRVRNSVEDGPEKDVCFRCLHRVKNVVDCCTCIVCFDAVCYHCFKDDVGYTSWFHEMVFCNELPVRNCMKWTLLGLGTMLLPCVLLYPIVGGAVKQCIKCRLKKTKFED